jgi:photosystem II stability/assembly factor-like uncharacterized protein
MVLVVLCSGLMLGGCVDDDPVQPEGISLTWELIEYPQYREISCMTIDPDGRIFLGMRHLERENTESRIYISTENGEHWSERELGVFKILSVASDSNGRLFATGLYCNILRSLDHGDTWEDVSCDTIHGCHGVLVIDTQDNLYLTTYNSEIFQSIDHGESWVRICEDLDPAGYLQSLTISSTGVFFATSSEGFYRSRDGGENWHALTDVPWGKEYMQIILDSIDRIFVRAMGNLYASNDDGDTWESLDPPKYVYNLFIDRMDRLFCFCQDGLYLSDDGGEGWVSILGYRGVPGLHNTAVNAAGDIFVTGEWGVCRSTDNGESWDVLGFTYCPPVDIAIGENGSFYVLIQYGGIYRSDGAFENWSMFNRGLPCVELYCLEIGPEATLLAGTSDGVYISREDSPDWTCAGLAGNRIVALFAISEDSIAASTGEAGQFVSPDGGTEWRHVGMKGYNIRSLIKTGDGDLLAGANFGGVFRYTGDGILWDQINEGLDDLRVTALVASSSGDILAGTRSRLFISTDGGSSWRRFNEEYIDVTTIHATGEDILIGAVRRGILWTRADIIRLYPQNDGVRGNIRTIITDPDRFVYVLTSSREIIRSTLPLEDAPLTGLRLERSSPWKDRLQELK